MHIVLLHTYIWWNMLDKLPEAFVQSMEPTWPNDVKAPRFTMFHRAGWGCAEACGLRWLDVPGVHVVGKAAATSVTGSSESSKRSFFFWKTCVPFRSRMKQVVGVEQKHIGWVLLYIFIFIFNYTYMWYLWYFVVNDIQYRFVWE